MNNFSLKYNLLIDNFVAFIHVYLDRAGNRSQRFILDMESPGLLQLVAGYTTYRVYYIKEIIRKGIGL